MINWRLVVLLLGLPSLGQAQARYDIIIRNGLVLDGTGAPRFTGDIAIRGTRIAAIGKLTTARAQQEIDATGHMVTPGFINVHSHASPAALPTAVNMLTQGVTTELLNADGGGPTDLKAMLEPIGAQGTAINVAASVAFNSVWQTVVGTSNRRPNDAEIERMQQMVLAGLEYGAYGVAAGLDYKPAYYATTDEVVRILAPAAKWRTFFPNHDRITPETGYSGRAGIMETKLIGERAGLVPEFTHMKITGREHGSAAATVAMMEESTAQGKWIATDVYPYLAGQTALAALIIPGWAQEGGIEALRGRLKDSTLRARIVAESDETIAARFNSPDGILVLGNRRLSDIAREIGASSPGAAVATILETESPWAILFFGTEPDVIKLMQYHSTAIACDCGAATGSRGHPRYYGSYPRVLGRYIREQRIMSWEDAVRKMSGLPAALMGLADRGLLAPGMAADVVVFDSATVIDHATFEKPDLFSEGIRHVIVNGTVALTNGAAAGAKAGLVLRRRGAIPSRPMDLATKRTVTRRGGLNGVSGGRGRIDVEIRQSAGARRATGRIDITWGGVRIRATSLGTLQTAQGWASITGRARVSSARGERAFTLIIDDRNPLLPGNPATLTMDVEDLPTLEAQIVDSGRR